MSHLIRRFIILFTVFCIAFSGVYVVRKMQAGGSLVDLFRGSADPSHFVRETYTLQDKPSIDLSEVEVLAAINAESAALVRAVVPSVVSIDTSGVRHERVHDAWGRRWVQPRTVQGQGSGVIVTKEGHVLTNHHVIQGTPEIRLTMHDGSVHSASVIGTDPTVDIAVLKIESERSFEPLKFGDSTRVEVGNTVWAIGSPFGLGISVTEGKISAMKRPFSDSHVDLLQTSAAINPGNSGGPLINIYGEIVGINSRIYSTNRDSPGFQGIGFAVPANAAFKTMKDILDRGRPIRGFLGMAMEELDAYTRKKLNIHSHTGVRVTAVVPGSPALRSGLKRDDVITRYEGEEVTSMRRLIAFIQQSSVGEEVAIEVWREGALHALKATIGEARNFDRELQTMEENAGQKALEGSVAEPLGVMVRNLTGMELSSGKEGIIITRILPDSELKGKLLTGDLIRAIDGTRVTDTQDFLARLVAVAGTRRVELAVQRGQALIRISLAPWRR